MSKMVDVSTAQETRFRGAGAELGRVKRALKTLSACNKALVNAKDEASLLYEICQCIVESGGYRLAWIGYALNDEKKTVRPVAQAGYEDGYLDKVKISWADNKNGRGPTGKAIRTGEICVLKDILTDPAYTPWRHEAMIRGYGSSVAIPLIDQEQLFGALNIYAAEPDAFDEEELKLLAELAEDLSYGISTKRTREQLKKTKSKLRRSEEKYRILAENALDGIYIIKGGCFEYVNPAFKKIFGYKKEEICNRRFNFFDLVHPEDRKLVAEREEARKRGKKIHSIYSFRVITKEGKTRHAEVNTVILPGNEVRVLGLLRDITVRRRAEKKLQQSVRKLQRTLESTVRAIAMTVEKKDPYTAGHQQQVTRLAFEIGKEMGLSEEKIKGIYMAGIIHDLGKINIPSEILSKPGKLTEIEFALIKTHSQVGYEILKTIEFPWPVAQIMLQHHERMDGSGYPQGLSGEEILLEARILTVSDVVEAMSSHRPYRPALGTEKALEEISKNRGILYDPDVVDTCLKIFKEKRFRFKQ